MAIQISAFGNNQFFDIDGNAAIGYRLFTYLARSSEKAVVYADINGLANHTNPIILDARGMSPSPIYIDTSKKYKFVFTYDDDTDPPASSIYTVDEMGVGFGEDVVNTGEWTSGTTPSFINTTQFSVVGNQTSTYQIGGRVKCVSSISTIYGTIITRAFTTVTTVTILPDSGVLDATLSAVFYSFLAAANSSWPGGYTAGLETRFAGPVTVPILSSFNLLSVGSIILYAGNSSPPAGYLLCNGAAVSRTTYAALFASIGTTFGVGDGSTTFNLPTIASISSVDYVIRYA